MAKLWLIPGICATLVLSGCLGSGGSQPSAEFEEAAPGAAEAALLTIEDLPDGWVVAPPDDDQDDDIDVDLSDDCNEVFDSDAFSPRAIAETESDEFVNAAGDSVSSDMSVYADAAAAAEDWDTVVSAVDDCAGEIAAAIEQYLRDLADESNPPDVAEAMEIAVSYEQVGTPALGDNAVHWRLTFDLVILGTPRPFITDIYAVHRGGMIGGVSYSTDNGDMPELAELERLANLIVGRMDAAFASLPQD